MSTTGAQRELALAAEQLDRRAFLRLSGAVAAAGLLPSGCGAAPDTFAPPADARLEVLSARNYSVFTAASTRLLGPQAAAAIAAGEAAPGLVADVTLARAPELGELLAQALTLLEFAPWPLLPKLSPFSSLAPADQDRVLEDLRSSRLALKRAIYRGTRSLACLAWYGEPQSARVTGYPGPFGGDLGIEAAFGYEPEV